MSLLDTFNDGVHETKSYSVTTKEELNALLDDPSFASADKIQLVEVLMDAFDAPRPLLMQAELTGQGNAYSKN